jgi:hypothetical protein
MKASFVRVVSLVGALALPTVLVAQANPSPAKSTTVEKSTAKTEVKTTTTGKGVVKKSSKKRRHHSKKTTQSQAAKPAAKK